MGDDNVVEMTLDELITLMEKNKNDFIYIVEVGESDDNG